MVESGSGGMYELLVALLDSAEVNLSWSDLAINNIHCQTRWRRAQEQVRKVAEYLKGERPSVRVVAHYLGRGSRLPAEGWQISDIDKSFFLARIKSIRRVWKV